MDPYRQNLIPPIFTVDRRFMKLYEIRSYKMEYVNRCVYIYTISHMINMDSFLLA